jgi:hypothetical protein
MVPEQPGECRLVKMRWLVRQHSLHGRGVGTGKATCVDGRLQHCYDELYGSQRTEEGRAATIIQPGMIGITSGLLCGG